MTRNITSPTFNMLSAYQPQPNVVFSFSSMRDNEPCSRHLLLSFVPALSNLPMFGVHVTGRGPIISRLITNRLISPPISYTLGGILLG